MGLDVFFRRDWANFLAAAAAANLGALNAGLEALDDLQATGSTQAMVLKAYRRGFFAALIALGLCVGLRPTTGITAKQLDESKILPEWVDRGQIE